MGSSAVSLVGTGIALGFVHVLTGPDHLSALATLSAGVGNCQAFSLGVRWGIGHSTGLLLVGIVLICLSKDDEVEVPHALTTVFESFVGVFMLLLGCFGLFRAWQKRAPHSGSDFSVSFNELPLATDDGEESVVVDEQRQQSTYDGGHIHAHEGDNSNRSLSEHGLSIDEGDTGIMGRVQKLVTNLSTKTVSILIGIVHGLAGPGGVLGVIPAVQIKDWRLSSLYLGSFCLSSTVVMGCFAATYGTLSAVLGRDARWEFQVECFSAALSVLVGVLWLTLLSLGQLENVFP